MIYDAMQNLKRAASPLAKNPKALKIAEDLRREMEASGTIPGRRVQ